MQHYEKTPIDVKVKLFINEENLGYSQKFITEDDISKFLETHGGDSPLKDSEEYIPRRYWDSLEELNKEDLASLEHPTWFIAKAFITENYKPKHDTLYITNPPKEYFYKHREVVETDKDVVYNDLIIIPPEFTDYYPIKYHSWHRENSTPFVDDCLLRHQVDNITSFLLTYDYKKVIFEGSEFIYNRLKTVFDNIEFIKVEEPKLKEAGHIEGLDISSPVNREDLAYAQCEEVTDEDLLAYWGRKLTTGGREKPARASARKQKVIKEATRESYIEYARAMMDRFNPHVTISSQLRPITPDAEKYFNRNVFPPMQELQGESLKLLGHPYWQITRKISLDHFTPRSKTMTVCACSNGKPYWDNQNYSHVKKRMKEGYGDVFINSCELWPLPLSTQLCARVYDWSHLRETPFVQDALIEHNALSIIYLYKHFGYENLIVYAPPRNPKDAEDPSGIFYPRLMAILEKAIPNVQFVMDEKTTMRLWPLLNNHYGLLKTRMWYPYPAKVRYDELIHYDGNDPVPDYTDEELAERAKNVKALKAEKKKKKNKENYLVGGGFSFGK